MAKEKGAVETAYEALRILGKVKYEISESLRAFRVLGYDRHVRDLEHMRSDIEEARGKISEAASLFVSGE